MSANYTFHIEAFTPETIPMSRLVQYMEQYARMLGHDEAVHFKELKPGSTQVAVVVDHEDVPKVQAGVIALSQGGGDAKAQKAQEELNRMLAADNASGCLYEGDDQSAQIIVFPGVKSEHLKVYGPFKQDGSIDGRLVSIGGVDETVHIQLQGDGVRYTGIKTNREIARKLAPHLYETVRLEGTGRWLRDGGGHWVLKDFKVYDFTLLASDTLVDVIAQLRDVKGSGWADMDDPLAALRELRDEAQEFA